MLRREWWPLPDSNRGPDDYETVREVIRWFFMCIGRIETPNTLFITTKINYKNKFNVVHDF
jgi:hypothetical protein